MPGSRTRLLFVAACPDGTGKLRPEVEQREVQARLEADVELRSIGAVRAEDLVRHLQQFQPEVLHFSGHAGRVGVCLEDDRGQPVVVRASALIELLRPFRGTLRLVFLNACQTDDLARELSEGAGIPGVLGFGGRISDAGATAAATRFYAALFRRREAGGAMSLEEAFRELEWPLKVSATEESPVPILACASGTKPGELRLAESEEEDERTAERRRMLAESRDRLPRAVAYKAIHDLLQEIEGALRPVRFNVQDGDTTLPAAQIRWASVRTGCRELARKLAELADVIARSPFATNEKGVGQSAESLAQRLPTAAQSAEPELLVALLDLVENLLGTGLPTMDKGLSEALEQLNLAKMAPALDPLPEGLPASVRREGTGAAALAGRIEGLRRVHHLLQETDNALRAAEVRARIDARKTQRLWRERLLAVQWDRIPAAATEVPTVRRLEEPWSAVEAAAGGADVAAFVEALTALRDAVRVLFNEVDVDLRSAVDVLNSVRAYWAEQLHLAA